MTILFMIFFHFLNCRMAEHSTVCEWGFVGTVFVFDKDTALVYCVLRFQ